jgi:exopolysaccharide biosynthesis polyprenyl glycosylphosphotransferase
VAVIIVGETQPATARRFQALETARSFFPSLGKPSPDFGFERRWADAYDAPVRQEDTFDAGCSAAAVVADALAVFGGFWLAVWIRFDTGWIPMFHEAPLSRNLYLYGAGVGAILFLLIFRSLGLYVRPQTGAFSFKIPRLVRAVGWGILLATALAFAIRTEPPFSRVITGLSFFTILLLVLFERWLLFKIEWHLAKHKAEVKRVVIIGANKLAVHIRDALKGTPTLRSHIIAFLRTNDQPPDPALPPELTRGTLDDLAGMIERGEVDEVICADFSLSNDRMSELLLLSERNLVSFHTVPDMFGMLTQKVHIEMLGDIPLLGLDKWPLDYVINRLLKRAEDIVGGIIGLLCSVPVIVVAAAAIKRESPGPVFFHQERCGEGGKAFRIVKLRTMRTDAEEATGPVWARPDDPRRTRIGAWLRAHNLDELPQFWNVLKGEMSLVGPRPERPHFVEQFKDDISRYMWRHASKPGITGWAQVNGLRGNTSIRDRIQYDLYYLENWSLALDFKIIVKTFFARQNAY